MIIVHYKTIINQYKTSGAHSGVAENLDQVCDAVSLGKGFTMFLSNFRKHTLSDAAVHPKRPVSSTINHSFLSCIRQMQKYTIFTKRQFFCVIFIIFCVTVNDCMSLCVLN
jgi:hypothetical protein